MNIFFSSQLNINVVFDLTYSFLFYIFSLKGTTRDFEQKVFTIGLRRSLIFILNRKKKLLKKNPAEVIFYLFILHTLALSLSLILKKKNSASESFVRMK